LTIKELAFASRQHTISHFHQENFFAKNNTTDVPHPPYSSLLPRLEIDLKSRHFDAYEVIEAESQAVLNTVTEHNFQDAFKK
jgi:hypothetical protein